MGESFDINGPDRLISRGNPFYYPSLTLKMKKERQDELKESIRTQRMIKYHLFFSQHENNVSRYLSHFYNTEAPYWKERFWEKINAPIKVKVEKSIQFQKMEEQERKKELDLVQRWPHFQLFSLSLLWKLVSERSCCFLSAWLHFLFLELSKLTFQPPLLSKFSPFHSHFRIIEGRKR